MAHTDIGGIRIEYETHPAQGSGHRLPVLLVMGLGMQLTAWPDALIDALRQAGHPVIRFDNRDAGLSSQLTQLGKPNVVASSMRYSLGLNVPAPYLLSDMAEDATGLLQALSIPRAHVVGVSMGGMIGQLLAIDHPQRVASFTCVMSSSGSRILPGPRWQARRALMSRPRDPRSVDSVVEHYVGLLDVIGSPGYPTPPAELRAGIRRNVERGYHPVGTLRQLVAIMASGDRSRRLAGIQAPTTIVHGQDDPLIPVAAAHDLARKIPHAQLQIIEGMGHDLPPGLVPRLAAAILETAARGEAAG